jgi:hypothetical protein
MSIVIGENDDQPLDIGGILFPNNAWVQGCMDVWMYACMHARTNAYM